MNGSMKKTSCPLRQLAKLVNGSVHGDPDLPISGFNGIELAGPGEITYILDARQGEQAEASGASACIVPPGCTLAGKSIIVAPETAVAAARIHSFLVSKPFHANGIHASAVIGANCQIPAQVSIGPQVCIGRDVRIGERVELKAGVVLEDGVSIGDDCILHAHVSVAAHCRIGNRVILHAGAVIGSDGFGFATDSQGRHHKKPQVGTVRIDDDVEIGANTCIDRAAFGVTWIRQGVKIDNLVMIGHNVVIGEGSILVAQAGIAGSTTLGHHVVLGAKAGVAGHLHLGDGVMAAAKSGIHDNLPKGAVVGGSPAIAAKTWAKAASVFTRLPELFKEIRRLRKEVDALRMTSEDHSTPQNRE